MKIIYNRFIPFKGFSAINLFGFVFARKEYAPLSARTINHEAIHTAQIKELLYIFFYILYVLEWLFRLVQYRSRRKAYRNISFEREAYENEHNTDYVKERRYFSFLSYILYKTKANEI